MPPIDRRAGRNLFYFTALGGKYFEPFDTYRPPPQDFQVITKKFLPQDWRIIRSGIWYNAIPPIHSTPSQGFKIHLSTQPRNAEKTIERVAPLCVREGLAFKVLLDHFVLNFTLAKNYMRGASGKFITIYPENLTQFKEFMAVVHEQTKDLEGPYILSDRRYKDSKVLFYRYGGFLRMDTLHVFGERLPSIQKQDGTMMVDAREAFFNLPEGVEDPFPAVVEVQASGKDSSPDEIVLNNRYLIKHALGFSNGGGVYIALDQKTETEVVIKEARPHINATSDKPIDAIMLLKKEYSVMQKLADTNDTPQPLDYFSEWEHHYLVEEKVQGIPFTNLRSLETFNALLKTDCTPDDIRRFCTDLLDITRKLMDALGRIHKKGIIVGDFAPQNIIYNDEDKTIKLIDFEGAYDTNNGQNYIKIYTPGFVKKIRTVPTRANDYYALGVVLFSLMLANQSILVLKPSAKKKFLDDLTKNSGMPGSLVGLILTLTGDRPVPRSGPRKNGSDPETHLDCRIARARVLIDEVEADLPNVVIPKVSARKYSNAYLTRLVQGIAKYIVATPDYKRKDRLFPCDYRVYGTNPLNVAYGALGTVLFLKDVLGEVPAPILQWIQQSEISPERYPPSLYVGLSGVAWAFQELGLHDKAKAAMEVVYASSLLRESADIFYGCAGVGMASLFFHRRTGDPMYLKKAIECAGIVKSLSKEDEYGRYWENVDGAIYYGYGHGGSGIALFLLKLFQATQDPEHLKLASTYLEYDIGHAHDEGTQLVWQYSDKEVTRSPYWRYGAAGVGSTLIRFYQVLGDTRYRDLAYKAAHYVQKKSSVFPGYIIGMTGIGEFFLDMYNLTGDKTFLGDVHWYVRDILSYKLEETEGIAFPGEELIRISTDFGAGSAGIGFFFDRIVRKQGRLFYDF